MEVTHDLGEVRFACCPMAEVAMLCRKALPITGDGELATEGGEVLRALAALSARTDLRPVCRLALDDLEATPMVVFHLCPFFDDARAALCVEANNATRLDSAVV